MSSHECALIQGIAFWKQQRQVHCGIRSHGVLMCSRSISLMYDGSLEILNATKNDEGVYTCLAENDRGKANSSGTLTITGVCVCVCVFGWVWVVLCLCGVWVLVN